MSIDSARLLRRSLRANAIFSATSGLVFLLGSEPVSAFLGGVAPVLVAAVGAQLLAFAAALVWLSTRPVPPRGLLVAVIAADLAWVLGTSLVVFADLFDRGGALAAVAVANVVLGFSVLQWMGARRVWPGTQPASPDPPGVPHSAKLAALALVLLPLLQGAAERAVTLPIGPSRMLTIGLWSLAWVPLARLALRRLGGSNLPRAARLATAALVPLLVVAHLIVLSRFGDGPFGPLLGGPFSRAATAAPASWSEAAGLRYVEVEVDAASPRTLETLVLVHEGGLYIAANMPEAKRWPRAVREDGSVRVRLAGPAVHALRADYVESSERTAALRDAMAAKYGFDVSLGGSIWFFALESAETTAKLR